MPKNVSPIPAKMGAAVFAMEADKDYILARFISSLRGSFESRAGFFAQQACEKYLKALSIQQRGEYLETHQLEQLATFCEDDFPFLKTEAAKSDLRMFDVFDQVGRYGGAAKYDPLSKGEEVAGTQLKFNEGVEIAGAWIWTDNHLQRLDQIVFWLRGFLDFSLMQYDDQLHSIIINNQRSRIVATWMGAESLFDVLTKQNKFFNPSNLRDEADE